MNYIYDYILLASFAAVNVYIVTQYKIFGKFITDEIERFGDMTNQGTLKPDEHIVTIDNVHGQWQARCTQKCGWRRGMPHYYELRPLIERHYAKGK